VAIDKIVRVVTGCSEETNTTTTCEINTKFDNTVVNVLEVICEINATVDATVLEV
jgi:hypothetical protein